MGKKWIAVLAALTLVFVAGATAAPSSVTIAGSLQSELGCASDWDPGCAVTHLTYDANDDVWQGTFDVSAGSWEYKAALNNGWDENYGQGGVPCGANIPFHVPFNGAKVEFRYDNFSHVLTITAAHAHDNNVEWDGLRFDSRDTLYRTPTGAVPAGTPVTFRFRTFHDDVTGVKMRVYDTNASSQQLITMQRVASGVSCYQDSLSGDSCDYWQARLANANANNVWYRFIVADGSKTVY